MVHASRPATVPRYQSFAEMFGAVWSWLRGVEPDWRQRAREQRIVEALVAEMDEAGEGSSSEPPTIPLARG
jgi:hypothetical protein